MKKILNILLAVLMVVSVALTGYAIATGGSDASISANLIWTYVLAAVAIVAILYSTAVGMVKSPAGIKKSLLSALLILVVVGVSVGIAMSHDGLTIPNSAGGVFEGFEVVITEAGILVTYVVAVAAVLVAIYSEVRNAFK